MLAEPSDACLVQACVNGDAAAFATLILRHGEPVAALIRRRIPASDVEDVLQETLLSVWTRLGTLSDDAHLKAWLLQVARSRCSDYYRSPSRRDVPLEDDDLEHLVNRYGQALPPDEGTEVLDALDQLSSPIQIIARLYYVEDLSIAQISRQLQCPQGTVKRRLFSARNHLRRLLDDNQQKEIPNMNTHGVHPFPDQRPSLHIVKKSGECFAVDCPELRWWFGVPKLEDRTTWALYDGPDWRLSSVTRLQTVGTCSVHDIAGVEICVDEWDPAGEWRHGVWTMHAHLTPERVGWLAVARRTDNGCSIRTFLDGGFDTDWGETGRLIEDRGRFKSEGQNVYRQTSMDAEALGCGLYTVTVGAQSFECLRVLDPGQEEASEKGILVEAFITRHGRTILFRRYNGRLWGIGLESTRSPWDEQLPANQRIVIDGVTYVHWYDCLTHLALE